MTEVLTQPQGLPEAEDVMGKLFEQKGDTRGLSDTFADDQDYVAHLDDIAPVQAYYIPTVTPAGGGAPESIRAQWVGVRLPVRSKTTIEEASIEGFAIPRREALHVLERDRPEANQWWHKHVVEEARRRFLMTFPTSAPEMLNFGYWIFMPGEGIVSPVQRFLGSLMAHDELFKKTFGAQEYAGQASFLDVQTSEV